MTEYQDIADALKREYGHKFTAHGLTRYDFSRHVYVGRAGALLLKADRAENLLRDALAALEYHRAQTRPTAMTDATIERLHEWLKTPNVCLKRRPKVGKARFWASA